ncbi:MAG: alpha-1,2-fucosyltransferase [Gammaproteobacteria bacterium]|nr:alpha-1,2-fucosyltransferase [Gammaproteobacteria bacterium]
MKKVIVRIKGGLGNQLFCYAAARRLALVNDAELVIDDVTGFIRDRTYARQYALDHFNIPCRKATPAERMEPFERYRRGMMKWLSRRKPFVERCYLEQEGRDFDSRLLYFKVNCTVYLDGLWQSEGYFKDVEQAIREDLQIIPPMDALNEHMAGEIRNSNAVALHVRWFDPPDTTTVHNCSGDYYQRAIALMERKIDSPCYFLFSDDLEVTRAKLTLPSERTTFVSQNQGDESAYADLWLMTQCKHFITANSTFSWWGAWLGENSEKIVVVPKPIVSKIGINSWGFSGQLPSSWIEI